LGHFEVIAIKFDACPFLETQFTSAHHHKEFSPYIYNHHDVYRSSFFAHRHCRDAVSLQGCCRDDDLGNETTHCCSSGINHRQTFLLAILYQGVQIKAFEEMRKEDGTSKGRIQMLCQASWMVQLHVWRAAV
jgi:hypothetical protein